MTRIKVSPFPKFTASLSSVDGARFTGNNIPIPLATVPVQELRPGIVAWCTAAAARLQRPVLLEITDDGGSAFAVWPDGVLAPVQNGHATRESEAPSTLAGACRTCGEPVPVHTFACAQCGTANPWAAFHVDAPARAGAEGEAEPNPLTADAAVAVPPARGLAILPPARVVSARIFSRRGLLIGGGVGVLAVLGAGATAIAMTAAGQTPQRPASPTSPAPAPVVTLPGWTMLPAQQFTGYTAVGEVGLLPGTDVLAFTTGTTAVLVDALTGKVTSQVDTEASGISVAVVDGSWAVLAAGGKHLELWSGEKLTHTQLPVPAGARLRVRGDLVALSDGVSIWRVSAAGLVSVVSPRPGTSLIGSSATGLLWASARGSLVVADDTGSTLAEVPLAPVSGLTLSTWLGVFNELVLTGWVDPLGAMNVAAHRTDTGELIGATPSGPVTQASVISAAGGSAAVVGTSRVDDGASTVASVPAGFTAATALGDRFLGVAEERPALLGATGVLQAVPSPAATVLGCTGNGALVMSTGGRLQTFAPETSSSK